MNAPKQLSVIVDKAKELGYSNMFYTPDEKEVGRFVEKYLDAIQDTGSKVAATTTIYGVANMYAIKLAKAYLLLEKNNIPYED